MTDIGLVDWKKKNDSLFREMDCFDEEFRKKSKCSCDKIVFENGKSYCKHLIDARTRKFRADIEGQINFLI